MKYELDRELRKLARQKAPSNIYLFPFANLVLRLNTCTSDNNVSVNKYITPGYKGAKLSTFVIEPKQYIGELPCICLYHGGGFLLKASKAHYQIAKWYAEKAKCKVVFTDYRLMPNYRYPVAIEDCYNTYCWILENAELLNINSSKIIVAGDSAGANAAAAISLMAKERKITTPLGALLVYPVVDRRMITDSMKKYTDTPVWDAKLTVMFWKAYLNNQVPNPIEYASPMEAKSLVGFPKTYIEVAEYDCLHDEGVELAKRLRSEGIPAELHEIKGACHGFEAATESRIVMESIQRRIDWINAVFV